MTRAPRMLAAVAAALALACALPPAAGAASRFVIRGAGFGHGVGMSQYGAYGMAKHGWTHGQILGHYYTGTALGVVDPARTVRVLLGGRAGVTRFTGATVAGGRRLKPTATYGARRRADGGVDLLSAKGRRLAAVPAPLRIAGEQPVAVAGYGAYRGAIELHPGGAGLDVVNEVGLEDYVRGVVARESPSSWPLEALKAQAVAARTYALTTSKGASGWDHYADTRSQVYGGVAAESPATDFAVAQTRAQVVTYAGRPVVTYFFSTSGGRTEDVENAFGGSPQPWLRSVEDPYDAESPRHRWAPATLTLGQAAGKLRGLVKGRFEGIDVVRRGRSPRIVAADVVGSKGRTRVSGSLLRARFGLYDTWAYFTAVRTELAPPAAGETVPPQQLDASGGVSAHPARLALAPPLAALAGHVVPARPGTAITVQRRMRGRWRPVDVARLDGDGRYRVGVRRRGVYRVATGAFAGPAVRVGGA